MVFDKYYYVTLSDTLGAGINQPINHACAGNDSTQYVSDLNMT
jgi:hypothetical protein